MSAKKRILVVEDDIFLRELCVEKLLKSKYLVDSAPDGKTGLQLMTEQDYDLILLDIMIPEMDGFAVLSEYKKQKPDFEKHTKVVMLSNLSEKEHIDKALSLGALDYIIKAHYSPTEIVMKVNELLGT